MYKKLFEFSGLTNGQICKKLNITYTSLKQFESNTNLINIEKFLNFAKLLEVDEFAFAKIVQEEIINKYKKIPS